MQELKPKLEELNRQILIFKLSGGKATRFAASLCSARRIWNY